MEIYKLCCVVIGTFLFAIGSSIDDQNCLMARILKNVGFALYGLALYAIILA